MRLKSQLSGRSVQADAIQFHINLKEGEMASKSNLLIKKLRLSFIWTTTLTDLFKVDQPLTPLGFVGNSNSYKQEFTNGLPWLPCTKKHYFWGHYLKDSGKGQGTRPPVFLQHIKPERAWKQLVPFRSKKNLPSVSTPEGRIVVEAFYYPFGFALAIHVVKYSSSLTVEQVNETAFKIRKDNIFSIQANDECKETQNIYQPDRGQTLCLDEVAELCLNTIRKVNLGLAEFPENGIASFDPFTVFTLIQGDGIDPGQSIENTDIHRMLEAVTTWEDPSPGNLRQLSEASFPFPATHPSHQGSLIYHHRRGRAVWFPIPLIAGGKQRTLSCFHRNLFLTSLQVESLSNLMIRACDDSQLNNLLTPPTYEFCARRAAGILGQLYGRAQTYNSSSAKIQIDDNEWKDSINIVRSDLNVGGELTSGVE